MFYGLIFAFALCLTIGITRSDKGTENVAINKPIYASGKVKKNYITQIVDGNTDGNYRRKKCSDTGKGELHWIVIDLGKPYHIDHINIWGRSDSRGSENLLTNMTVKVGDKYLPCQPNYLDDYKVCESFQEMEGRPARMPCKKRGQFVAVFKGGPRNTESLILCEVEVFGTPVAGGKAFKEPQPKKFDGLIKSKSIGAKDAILQGISSVTARKDISSIFVIDNHAEAVIWLPKTKDVYVAAAKVGKGKVIIVASDTIIKDWIKNDNSIMVKNIKQWLTGENNAEFKDYRKVKDLTLLSKNTILYNHPSKKDKPEQYDRLIEAIKVGGFSAILCNYGRYNKPLDKIMRASGMFVPYNRPRPIRKSNEVVIIIKDMLAGPVYPVVDTVTHLLSSITIFQDHGLSISRALKDTPKEFLSSVKIGPMFVQKVLQNYALEMEWKAPCAAKQVSDDTDKTLIMIHNNFLRMSNHLIDSGIKAPGVMTYPGDFKTLPPLKSAEIEIFAEVENEIHPTGFYLPPGQTMEVTIVSPADEATKWTLEIGCWRDNIKKRPGWERYPVIRNEHPLVNGKIHSSFGGNVVIWNKKTKGRVTVRLNGVIEAPYFNLRDPKSFNQWNDRRNAPAPWAEMAGDGMTLCFESKFIRHQTAQQMKELSEHWDFLVKSDHNLLGTDWRQKRRERVVMDLQISAGSGHSGYPIMAMLPWELYAFNMSKIRKTGMWGMCHEVGHNMQRYKFTWSKTGEVTNNVFCLWNYEKMLNKSIFGDQSSLGRKMNLYKKYLNGGKISYDAWGSSPWLALGTFAQMADSFGWGLYKEVFRKFTAKRPDYVPKTDQDKIDIWAKRVSEAVGQNLIPIFDFWGLPVSTSIRDEMKKYVCVMPDDTIAKMAPERVEDILKMYDNRCTRKAKKVIDRYPDVDVKPIRANDVIVRNL